ncbi:L-arginine responsive protein LaoB [Escherichia coli]
MSISRGLSKIRDLLIGRRVSRVENATSATQIPNDNRKKNHTQKGSESFAFNWGLFRWRCGVLNVKTVGGRICGRNRLWYRGGEDSIISSPSSSLYQITGTINL